MNALPSLETHPSPIEFFDRLKWIDGRPLLDTIEPYRRDLFMRALYTFRDDGAPLYNMMLAGRGKKNFKSCDLVLAGIYCLLCLESPQGNECYIIANDLKQAGDDLSLAKKLVEANADEIGGEVEIFSEEIKRVDGRGFLQILPARDSIGAHGKTYLFLGLDEIHGWRDYDLLEAMAPDPTRPDTRIWITSYDTIYNSPGIPLHDLKQRGIAGDDPRMLFSWYSGETCTDPDFAEMPPEYRANPSMGSWPEGIAYIDQQRRRLPTHKFRRLHLNMPGAPTGAFLDPDNVLSAIVSKRQSLSFQQGKEYCGFVDMSGGSSDDATLGIAHQENGKTIVDLVTKQVGDAPFNPRHAVLRFATLLKSYGLRRVTGDNYAGSTFKHDFEEMGITYIPCAQSKTVLYEELEPKLNAGEVELPDIPKLQEQLLGLVVRGARIDHIPNEHDDFANAAAGAVWCASGRSRIPVAQIGSYSWG
ncbi:hypothetical protein [Bradyrhizobium sp. AUGA SZCCT0182]|uniref:hypothetical protein n=1 Tax=Bradyrhizobium sp. AUGA SZCCT0182 TaxID=2807667 RepID=UPI001BA9802D|nr:hypothetical protein [Bradyrhizobium sp. AUGA SZCCT0182]MBR1233653.1 hypothetical protein [Bradyrhizobium sp. AUGA SZCCT0182]